MVPKFAQLKMHRLSLSLSLLTVFFLAGQCQSPPQFTGSYKAWGEVVESVDGMPGEAAQETFQETYDADTQNSAFRAWVTGKNVTFVENFKTKQTFRYSQEDYGLPITCEIVPLEVWASSMRVQFFEGYKTVNGSVRFALKQMFDMPDNKVVKRDVPATFRNIPARKWDYEFKVGKNTTNVYAFWSKPSWNTSSPESAVPLGFIITRMQFQGGKFVKVRETVINVYGFVPSTYDRKMFEPVQGVYCPKRKATLKFPKVTGWKSVALHSEMILPGYREIKYVDTYLDPIRKMLRIDAERIVEEDPEEEMKEKKYESEIAISLLDVVYRKTFFRGKYSCKVVSFDNYTNDVQNFFNVKDSDAYRANRLFGTEETSYVHIGKTVKGDIPCNLFQGIRTDWPDENSNVTSLWEWCFNVNMSAQDKILFRNGEFGLISAQATVLQSDNPLLTVGDRMFHHFYEVTDKSPSVLGTSVFDISNCFDSTKYRALQFEVDWKVAESNKQLIVDAAADKDFLYQWRRAISTSSGLPFYYLRVSYVKAVIVDTKLLIQFLLLDVHPDLPNAAKVHQISLEEAHKTLSEKIDKGGVSINYKPDSAKEGLTLGVVAGTLQEQINSDFTLHTLPPYTEPTTKSTPSQTPFSLRTEPDGSSSSGSTSSSGSSKGTASVDGSSSTPDHSSTTPKTKEEKRIEYKGSQPGAVAAVSISMLLIGITIGTGGTFVKYYGLPECLSRR